MKNHATEDQMTSTRKAIRPPARPRRGPAPEFGEVVRARLDTLGMTQTELADKLGLTLGYISNMTRGASNVPSEPVIRQMAELLGADGDAWCFLARVFPYDLESELLGIPAHQVRAFARGAGQS